ncbi:hypothetical protein [Flavobacterium gelatinilyticum]|uniref:hypothetical protein n=1 Tax=Flavobacterium gelatinilyticum TaxID=3003260 RepID=UPI00247FC15B|nr:hypothetical protein [Flavobacterium gelatinilyticum]
MKNVLITSLLLISFFVNAQDYTTINKMQSGSLSTLKEVTAYLANLSGRSFELYKEKDVAGSEYYLLVYLPSGLTPQQIEESRVNRYENGIVFKLLKLNSGLFKLKDFWVEPTTMFNVIKTVFYPDAIPKDDYINVKYRSFIDSSKGYKFYFHPSDSPQAKYQFYSY